MKGFVDRIKLRLKEKLPGPEAQYRMAPQHRERIEMEMLKAGQYKPSAVMILFCLDDQQQVFIPLIRRAAYDGVHSRQISFPGGKYEDSDGSLENTAVRECREEIGLSDIEVIGKLTPLYIPVSGFLVEPFVGFCKTVNPSIRSQEREVESVLKMPLEDLLNDSKIENGSIEIQNKMRIQTNWFALQNDKVWGATAMILSELKETIRDAS